MGFRFRKSINLGGGFKVNLSKSGVGYSWGTKGVRYTKTASGKKRTTLSIPGTGISYVTESDGKKKSTKLKTIKSTSKFSAPSPDNGGNGGNCMLWVKFIICVFFGYLGVHKFMEKKIGMGILYLFTMGLFCFGWIFDCVKYLIAAIKSIDTDIEEPIQKCEETARTTTEYPPVELPAKHGFPVKKVLLWVLAVFLMLIAVAYLPHISGIIALVAAAIVAPVEKWQNKISCFIKGKTKTITVTVMAILALFSAPTTDSPEVEPADPGIAVMEATEIATTAPTVATTEATTEPETVPPAEVERISFDENSYTVGVGRTVDIPFGLYPENATSSTLEASIDNTEIAILSLEKKDENIVQIIGIIPGEATITLKSGETIIATKDITVAEVMPEGIKIVADPQMPCIGSSGAFTVEFDPPDVTIQDVTWQSDAPNVIKVNEDGSYEALSIGEAAITATHENGVGGMIRMEVLPVEVESIMVSADWEEGKPFCRDNSMALVAEVYPENATDKSITWTSSDESIAIVSNKGVVKAISQGTVVITAEAANGKSGTYQITVDRSPQKFRVSASISMKSNDHVGNNWSTGFEFNDEQIKSGSTVSILPGETFTACGWAQDNDSNPDYGSYWERLTLTDEMCKSGFTIEGEADVRENGGRYSGNYAVWYVTIKFTPIN